MIKQLYIDKALALLLSGVTIAFIAGCSGSNVAKFEPIDDPSVVAQFGPQALTLQEFEAQYARSVGDRQTAAMDSAAAYTEFLDRYVDFRLKVMYAKELGLDQDSSLSAEIDTYRKQLARPYLLEKEILDPILKDLYEKKQRMVDASHILIRVARSAAPAETEAAYEKIAAIKDSIMQGHDFGELAYRNSEDPSARGNRIGAKGRLGYFVGGQMVKEFEDQAFTTPVGDVSEIFQSDFGYHMLFVHDRKAKEPDVWASHIAIRHFKSSDQDTLDAESRIAEALEQLNQGADFAELAKTVSEDRETGARGGQIGRLTFTQQGMPATFKDALFSLENPGDYSGVVRTDYGYHIIRLDRLEEPETFEESYDALKTHASRLPRLKKAEEEMALKVRETHGFAVDTTTILTILDGRHFGASDILETSAPQLATPVITIGTEQFIFEDVVTFAKTASIPFQPDTLGLVLDAVNRFLNDEALNYEAAQLENRDEEFGRILREFKDGLLLFKLMEDSVWTAAAMDTAGLMAYHAPRADSFWFEDRNRIVSFRSVSDSLLESIAANLDSGMGLGEVTAMVAADTTMNVRMDTTFLAGPNNSIFDSALKLAVGEHTTPVLNTGSYLMMVNDGVEPARRKTFDESRSEVLNAYQTIYEAKLLDRLHKKYGVLTYHDRLDPAFQMDKEKTSMAEPERLEDKIPDNGR